MDAGFWKLFQRVLSLVILSSSFLFPLITENNSIMLSPDAPGDLDLDFGAAGIVTFDVNSVARPDYIYGMTIQPFDGKFVVVGTTQSSDGDRDILVARLMPDGFLDNF